MKTFKLTITEDEMRALIVFHSSKMCTSNNMEYDFTIETSERIHTLTKRLNKDTPENDPIPNEPAQATAAKDEPEIGW